MIFKVGCHAIGKFRSQLQYYHFEHICLIHVTFTFVPHFKLALRFMLVRFLPELYSTRSNYYYLPVIVIITGGICVLIYTKKIYG